MEVLRKRSRNFCDCCSTSSKLLNGNTRVHSKCTKWNQELGTTVAGGCRGIGEDGHAQKRKCNGVSSYFLQADYACVSNHSCISSSLQQDAVSSYEKSLASEKVTSQHTSFQTNSTAISHPFMAPTCTVPLNLKDPETTVCQRCLAGEPGHISHILC